MTTSEHAEKLPNEPSEAVAMTGDEGTQNTEKPAGPHFELVQMLPDHAGNVCSLIFSKDGRRLFAGTFMNQIKIWDWIEDEEEGGAWQHKQTLTCKSTSKLDKFRKAGDTHTISALVLGPDDKFLVAGSVDKNLRIYQINSAGDYKETQCLKTKAGFLDSEIGYLAVHPNGKILLVASAETGNKIFIYKIGDNATLNYLKTCEVNNELVGDCDKPFVRSLVFAPDGRLALGLPDKVIICDVKTDQGILDSIHHLSTEEQEVNSISFSPNNFYVAVAAGPILFRVFGKIYDQLQMVVDTEEAGIALSTVRFSPDGRLLVGAGMDGNMYVWRKGVGAEDDWVLATTVEVEGSDSMVSVAFHPGGKYVAAGEMGVVRVWKYAY